VSPANTPSFFLVSWFFGSLVLWFFASCNIINFARGELVDHAALKAAIDAGIYKGNYVSDFPNKEIFEYDQVIAMPHLGASTAEAEENSSSMAAETIMSFLETGSVVNSVNFPTGNDDDWP